MFAVASSVKLIISFPIARLLLDLQAADDSEWTRRTDSSSVNHFEMKNNAQNMYVVPITDRMRIVLDMSPNTILFPKSV